MKRYYRIWVAGVFAFISVLVSNPVTAQVPVIKSFSPMSAPVNATVTIQGTGFNSNASSNIVYFGATQASVISSTATQLTVKVPSGASYQFISVTTNGLTAYSSIQFVPTFTGGGSIDAYSFVSNVTLDAGDTPQSIFLNDLDGDGLPDLTVFDYDANEFIVIQNTYSGTVGGASPSFNSQYEKGENEVAITTADYNGDGKMDIIAEGGDDSEIDVYPNTGAISTIGNNSSTYGISSVSTENIASGDLNADGFPDIVMLKNNNSISVFPNSNGTFSDLTRIDLLAGSFPAWVAIADLDGDLLPEILVTDGNSGTTTILRNTSSHQVMSFADASDIPAIKSPTQVITGDLDGDGKPEIVVIGDSKDSVSVYQNNTGTDVAYLEAFENKISFATGKSPTAFALGDLDGDGKPDLAVANGIDKTVSVYRNQFVQGSITTSSFASPVAFSTGGYPNGIVIGDVNMDGAADMAITNGDDGTITLLQNAIGAPHITVQQQPKDTTFCSGNGSISVIASAGSTIQYQWQTQTTKYDDSGNPFIQYTAIHDNSAFSGTNSQSLNIKSEPGIYSCLLTASGEPTIRTNTSSVNFSQTPPSPTGQGASGCIGASVTLSASDDDDGTYEWYEAAAGGTPLQSQSGNTFSTPVLTSTTSYYVSIRFESCESSRIPVVATITMCGNDSPPAIQDVLINVQQGDSVVIDLKPLISDAGGNIDVSTLKILIAPKSGATTRIEADERLLVDYSGLSFTGTDHITIQVCDENGLCGSTTFAIDVADQLTVFEGISPNGDSKNDYWEIQNINVLSDTKLNRVIIYDRWGDSVFETSNYDNTTSVFTGTSTGGNELPSGIYFYKITFASGRQEVTGYLSLKR